MAGLIAPDVANTGINAALWEAIARASVGVEELLSWDALSLVSAWSAHAASVVEHFTSWAILCNADARAHSLVPLEVLWAFLGVAGAKTKFGIPVVRLILAFTWGQLEIANIDVESQTWGSRALVRALALLVGDGPVSGVSIDGWAATSWGGKSLDTVGHVEVVVCSRWFLVVASAAAVISIPEVGDSIDSSFA